MRELLAEVNASLERDAAEAQVLLDRIEAAPEALKLGLRRQLSHNPRLMEGLAATLSSQEFRDLLVDLQVDQSIWPEHTEASTADDLIRDVLAPYDRYGRQIDGDVAIVDDANWEVATYDLRERTKDAAAFVDSRGNVIVHQSEGDGGTMVHEGVHKYSDGAVRALSWDLNEGITEYFTRQILRNLPSDVTIDADLAERSYPDQYRVVDALVDVVGEESVARAYFDGQIEPLKQQFLRQTGRPESDWDQFIAHMNNESWLAARALLFPWVPPQPTPTPVVPGASP